AVTSLLCLSLFFFSRSCHHLSLHSFPTRRSSDLVLHATSRLVHGSPRDRCGHRAARARFERPSLRNREKEFHAAGRSIAVRGHRSEEHTSELQSRENLVCRLLLEKKKKNKKKHIQ